jgi:hypothetical protein
LIKPFKLSRNAVEKTRLVQDSSSGPGSGQSHSTYFIITTVLDVKKRDVINTKCDLDKIKNKYRQ